MPGRSRTLNLEHDISSHHLLESNEFPSNQEQLSSELKEDLKDILAVYFEGSSAHNGNLDKASSSKRSENPSLVSFLTSFNATMPWLQNYIRTKVHSTAVRTVLLFADVCLRGIGQVYFQNNPFSGLLILAGLFVQSSRIAIHGVIALVCGNIMAYSLGFDKGLIQSGLFGYNSVLVGLALSTFDSNVTNEHAGYKGFIVIGAIIFSSISSLLFVFMGKLFSPYKSPPLTLPFNVATAMFLLATAHMARVELDPVQDPALPNYTTGTDDLDLAITAKAFFAGAIRGIGQVYLANNIVSGALVLAGIAVCSRISACAALVGSCIGSATALALGASSPEAVEQGIFGFNPALSVTAMYMFYAPSKGAAVYAVLAGVITVFAQHALATLLEPYGLPVMTLPFCVVALPFIILQGTTSIVTAIPLASITVPEDHLRRIHTLNDGFAFLMDAIQSSTSLVGDDGNLQYIVPNYRSQKVNASLRRLSGSLNGVVVQSKQPTLRDVLCCKWLLTNKKPKIKQLPADDHFASEVAPKIFQALDRNKSGHLSFSDVTDALQAAGLRDDEGLHFASLVLHLMDLDESGTIEEEEFIAFCLVSMAIQSIRRNLAKFFDFVDLDGNGFIDFAEIDASSEYLGRPVLTELDTHNFEAVLGSSKHEDDGMDVVELINFVTVSKISKYLFVKKS
jgi:urea transporter